MVAISANRLVLNLRLFAQSTNRQLPNLIGMGIAISKTDAFFRRAYSGRHDLNPEEPRSMMDTILGNIGEPLRVGDEDEEKDEELYEREEEGMEV